MTEAELKNGILLPKPDGDVVRVVYALDGDKLTTGPVERDRNRSIPSRSLPKAGDPVMEIVLRRVKD